VNVTASVLRTFVTWQGKNVKFPDDDVEMSKHLAVYILYKEILL